MSREVIDLIHRMSLANPGWSAPRIHGELLKLRFKLSQTTVAKYLVRHRRPPSQNWRTLLINRMQSLVSADFFVVPTITFRLLFVFVILSHDRRRPIHLAVTANPTTEWTTPATAGSFPLGPCASLSASRSRRVLRKGIPRSDKVAGHSRSPHGSAIALAKSLCRAPDRTIRRECLDHVIALNETGLRRVLKLYFEYYERTRTHLSLDKDAPIPRTVQPPELGRVVELPEVGGLHHRYERRAA